MKKIGKYIFPIFFVFLLTPGIVSGQKNIAGSGLHEVGLGIGAFNYTGDLAQKFYFRNFRPGGMLFYRLNLSPVVNFRASIAFGSLRASDENVNEPVPQLRNQSFSTGITELGLGVEYNFLNYRPKKETYRFSPYFASGLAFYTVKTADGLQVAIPLGMGIKYRASKKINLGFEFVARKTFTDKIDGISSYFVGTHQTSNPNDNDWYYYTGISISYSIYHVVCKETLF